MLHLNSIRNVMCTCTNMTEYFSYIALCILFLSYSLDALDKLNCVLHNLLVQVLALTVV